jgi:excisionase family DNA binding protein
LTVPEVAELLRTTPIAIYAMVERGKIPGVLRVGRRLLFSEDVLRTWIAERTTGPESTPAGAVLHMRRGRRRNPTT